VAADAVAAPAGGVAGKAEVPARGLSSLAGGGLRKAHASHSNLAAQDTGTVRGTATATAAGGIAVGKAAEEEEEGGGRDAIGTGLALARSALAHGDDVRDRGARGVADREDQPRASWASLRVRRGAGCSSDTGWASSDVEDVVRWRSWAAAAEDESEVYEGPARGLEAAAWAAAAADAGGEAAGEDVDGSEEDVECAESEGEAACCWTKKQPCEGVWVRGLDP
jgi:hypothetical protein